MKPKKLILWIVLVVLVAFLIWFITSVLFGPFTFGQKWNTTQLIEQSHVGTLMKHKGQVYCYNENTTSKETVLKAKERNSIDETIYQNAILSSLAEDNWELAESLCQSMVEKGQFPRDNQGEEIELEGTLTLKLK